MTFRFKNNYFLSFLLTTTLISSISNINILAKDNNYSKIDDFKNILDVKGNPTNKTYDDYGTNKFNNFSYICTWHGYYLPKRDCANLYGGFVGPFIIGE